MAIEHSVLNKFSDIIDTSFDNYSNKEFYLNILSSLSGEVSFAFSGIYFLDNVSLSPKAFYCPKKASTVKDIRDIFIEEKYTEILNFLNTDKRKTFCVKYSDIKDFLKPDLNLNGFNFLFSKLAIKGSFFGFMVLLREKKFSEDEISISKLHLSIFSYLIKDFELNKVFKNQLNLLQDAISDKENALKVIEKQNKKLIQADLAKTSFLANVSHELRTPLNAVIGFSDVLSNQIFGKLNEKQMEYVKDINLSAVHLLGLINSLLDFSKIESGSMKLNLSEFSPEVSVNEVINILRPLIDAKEIEISYKDTFQNTLTADFQKFQQILFNLIGNAIKFSPQKGKICVRTKKDEEYFILEVEDFGIGIEKKYHNFIFKKFTQIDNIYTKTSASTGLGLAITKEYVKLHKGKIYVISSLGRGSTFVVKLKNRN